jgi:hypothetical protein
LAPKKLPRTLTAIVTYHHQNYQEKLMTSGQNWYIVKVSDQTCQIVTDSDELVAIADKWGPYASRDEAIAKRVGLIRAGKCQPI